MKSSTLVFLAVVLLAIITAVSVAKSVPPTPPTTGAVYPLGYNGTTPLPVAMDPYGDVVVASGGATAYPAISTPSASVSGACTQLNPTGTTVQRLTLVVIESSSQQAAGTDLALYDTTSNSNCTTNYEIYHTGQAGAGAAYPLNIPISSGDVFYKFTGGTWVGGFRAWGY